MIKNIEEITNKVFCGDAFEIIKNFPDNCIDMILTSLLIGVVDLI